MFESGGKPSNGNVNWCIYKLAKKPVAKDLIQGKKNDFHFSDTVIRGVVM